MLEETETEETLGIFCHIFVIGDILIRGKTGPPAPLVTPICWPVLFRK